jgi:hypothetical protein
MKNIADIIPEVCRDSHVLMVQEAFGDGALDALFTVQKTVQLLYQHIEPDRIKGHVILFQVIRSITGGDTSPALGPAADFSGLANQDICDLCFEVESDGQPYARRLEAKSREELTELAKTAVVYHYYNAHEEFLAGSLCKPVPRLDPSARSQFSVPTFSDLREALLHYARENVRESSCYIFRHVWHDTNRLFLNAGPESLMRDSLTQFLKNRLGGDHDVWPEQNVNERNPVDIRVQTKFRNNRLMLIEIKWLGDSVASDGHVTARHRDRRAQEGAVQLAEYLDEQRCTAPSHVIQGYYVIIDARRQNLPADATTEMTITRANGLHYEAQDLEFNPAPHLTRHDFDLPYRMFAAPRCCD